MPEWWETTLAISMSDPSRSFVLVTSIIAWGCGPAFSCGLLSSNTSSNVMLSIIFALLFVVFCLALEQQIMDSQQRVQVVDRAKRKSTTKFLCESRCDGG
mmetsp:Transcript_36374/g.81803  ORF Transcript_36374/g.81803 Transcript_36374/m.81803 type:complete len:100 (+) Transcript_36374:1183-1482(+)